MRYGFVDIQGTILVRRLADAAAEAAYNPADGALAYREDTDEVLFRVNGVWQRAAFIGGAGAPLLFGASSLTTPAAPRFLFPGYADAISPTSAIQMLMPRSGVLRNLFINHRVGGTTGAQTLNYTVRVGNAVTALAVSIAPTVSSGSNLVDTAVVAQGDLVDIRVTGVITTSPTDIIATMEIRQS